jgi:hypothetical protein
MQEEGTQYRQRPWATRSAAARMLSTVPSYTVGVNPAARHISTVNWLNSGAGKPGVENRPDRCELHTENQLTFPARSERE